MDAGYSHGQLRQAGYGAADLRDRFPLRDLMGAGFGLNELGRLSADELRDAHPPIADLWNSGYDYAVAELHDAGYTAAEIRGAGYSAKALLEAGYTARDLRIGGYPAGELRGAGLPLAEIRGAGYSAKDLRGAGYSAKDLRDAGCPDTPLYYKEAGYSAKETYEAGFLLEELNYIGYTATDLYNSGFFIGKNRGYPTAWELEMAGFSAEKLRKAGYSA